MTANELRIGNYVKFPNVTDEEYSQIEAIGITIDERKMAFGYNVDEIYDFDDIEPIPLTDELFEQFGFEKKVDLFGKPKNTFPLDYIFTKDGLYIHKYTYPENVDVYEFRFPNIDPWIYSPVKLEYAHQLQNLYFALKGEELELTQKPE